jgi:hypothetical protein
MDTILDLQQVGKIYQSGNRPLTILNNISFLFLRAQHSPSSGLQEAEKLHF